jgi:uncharacterized membrane protein
VAVKDPSDDVPRQPADRLPFSKRPAVHVLSGFIVGIFIFWLAQRCFHRWYFSLPLGWDCLAFTFTMWTWLLIWRFDGPTTKTHAKAEEPGRTTARGFILVGALLSLASVGLFLKAPQEVRHWAAVVAVLSIVIWWLAIHTLYALKYAERYYANGENGIDFNAQEDPRYSDFAYLACAVGMSFAISDTNLKSWQMRRTALGHAMLSYVFGSVIIASVVNLIAGL